MHERMLGGELLQHLRRPVVAAVVDDDELAGVRQRQERFAREPHELREILRLVLGGHEDAHVRPRGVRGEAHSRFRMRAGRMPSWSRYLATVRRAIFTPLRANISTICWSVSGVFSGSSSTSF